MALRRTAWRRLVGLVRGRDIVAAALAGGQIVFSTYWPIASRGEVEVDSALEECASVIARARELSVEREVDIQVGGDLNTHFSPAAADGYTLGPATTPTSAPTTAQRTCERKAKECLSECGLCALNTFCKEWLPTRPGRGPKQADTQNDVILYSADKSLKSPLISTFAAEDLGSTTDHLLVLCRREEADRPQQATLEAGRLTTTIARRAPPDVSGTKAEVFDAWVAETARSMGSGAAQAIDILSVGLHRARARPPKRKARQTEWGPALTLLVAKVALRNGTAEQNERRRLSKTIAHDRREEFTGPRL